MLKTLAILIDIECFSRLPNAAVSEISLLLMDLSSGAVLGSVSAFLNPYDQKGHIEDSTEAWCLKNLPKANIDKSRAAETDKSLAQFLIDVEALIQHHQLIKGDFRIYSRGSNFDLPILTCLISHTNGYKPHEIWDFRSEYCHRTALEIAFNGAELAAAENEAELLASNFLKQAIIKHDSYHDVVYEAFLLHLAFKKLQTITAIKNSKNSGPN